MTCWRQFHILAAWIVLSAALVSPASVRYAQAMSAATTFSCSVTEPNGLQPPPSGNAYMAGRGDYGNAWLWTSLWIWGEGVVSVPASQIAPDGVARDLKWSWYRFVPGELTITGRRLEADAPPLVASVPSGYGDRGFQVSGITFPTVGCWEVTGHLGDASLTFVVQVERLGAGTLGPSPSPRTPVDPCPVTQPNGVSRSDTAPRSGDYGNTALGTNLLFGGVRPGMVHVPDGAQINAEGIRIDMPWSWDGETPGVLSIEGWRLDRPSAPLDVSITEDDAPPGFAVAELGFPDAGCWEIVGNVGPVSLAVIVEVISLDAIHSGHSR